VMNAGSRMKMRTATATRGPAMHPIFFIVVTPTSAFSLEPPAAGGE
jgi:hypothetical protein